MLTCSNCLRQAIKALDIPPGAFTSSSRSHSTFSSIRKPHHHRAIRAALKSKKPIPPNRERRPSVVNRRDAQAKEANKHMLGIRKTGESTPTTSSLDRKVDQALRIELGYINGDALKLANAVQGKLRSGDAARALELIRASERLPGVEGGKNIDSVVSWNHIMDYYMSKALIKEAFKVFNEMKKRGHKPDAHTFTIMLRGYAMNHKTPGAVDQAMKVYDSISRPESTVKPSIIHSNAIINCLGRADNMDSLWAVAGRLPERGPGAPDKWTYTTILNAIRAGAVGDASQLRATDGDEVAPTKAIKDAIREGKSLWEDVVSRWRAGEIHIDESLVCAMGRLLLLGQKEEWSDIFSLVEQTMRIPRLNSPNLKSSQHEGIEAVRATSSAKENQSLEIGHLSAAVEQEASSPARSEFRVVELSDRPLQLAGRQANPSSYAAVGSNVLSLLLEASCSLKELAAGKKYWDWITSSKGGALIPDENNLKAYLRLLRVSRSSRLARELLEHPLNAASEGTWYKGSHFVIAMSTCARDMNNPNSFTHASAILDLMENKLKEPVLKVITMYLSLALATTPGVSTTIPGKFDANPGSNNFIRAIRRLQYSDLDYKIWVEKWRKTNREGKGKDWLFVGKRDHHKRLKRKDAPSQPEELLEHLRLLHKAYDKFLMHRPALTSNLAEEFLKQKRDITQALQTVSPDALPPLRSKFRSQDAADILEEDSKGLRGLRTRGFPADIPEENAKGLRGPRIRGFPVAGRDLKPQGRQSVDTNRFPKREFKPGLSRPPEILYPSRGDARQQGHRDQPVTVGWDGAWKKSLRGMNKDNTQKEWVVL